MTVYNFQADGTGSYTIVDEVLSSPQENINFKSNVLFPALYAYGLNEEIVTFEISIKGQASNPQGMNCFWIGSENLPTQDEFHDSYGFFRIWDNKMQAGFPCMAYGTAQYQVFESSAITISDSEFIDLQWKVYRNGNSLYVDFNYKSPNSTAWNSAGTSTIDNYNYSLGGYLNALLFVRANNTEYVPYTDLTKTRILANGLTIWRAIASGVSQPGVHIQLRHDTAANWTSVNPVLLEGEVGIETDTRKQKFGDGVTAWNSLPYDVGSTALQSITSSNVTDALGYTPVNKAGDTMTGTLNISTDSTYIESLNLKNTNITANSVPSTNSFTWLAFKDTNNTSVGGMYLRDTTNERELRFRVDSRNGNNDAITIGWDNNNAVYTTCPSCGANNSIVTTVSKSKSQNGYYKLGNGLIIQWGTNSVAYSSNTINLPTAFTSTNYIALAIPANITNGYGVTGRATTSFTFNATASTTIDWVAVGY